MTCRLIGTTPTGAVIKFDFADIIEKRDVVCVRLSSHSFVEVLPKTVRPEPDERDSVVEIMQAVGMLPATGYCNPGMKIPRLLLDREDVMQTIRLKAIGNGQCPQALALAWITLTALLADYAAGSIAA